MRKLFGILTFIFCLLLPLELRAQVSNPGFIVQSSGTTLGFAGTLNCSTNVTCTLSGSVVTVTASGGGGGSVTIQTNATNNAVQTTLNFITSSTNTAGLTITPINPATTGNERLEITGTLACGSLPSFTGGATNSACAITLANPSASTLGGIESITSASHNWIAYIDTSGVPHQSQPAISDLTATFSSPLSLSTNTLSCPTCVVASSPGAGIAHFAGSTQTVTSSAVNLAADVTGQLPIAAVGSGGLSGVSPISIASTGAISITGAAGQILAGASPAFTATPVLGTNASVTGTLGFANGGGSGVTVTVQNPSATGTYNFNLPATSGSTGNLLTSGGGGSTAMTWTVPGTGVATFLTTPTFANLSSAVTGATITQTVAGGTIAMPTSAISSAACGSAGTVTTTVGTLANVLSGDNLALDFNGSPIAITGYIPSTSGMLTILKWPGSGAVTAEACNNTSSSITPGAVTLNWHVYR